MIDVAPNTIVIYADIACPWSHLAVYRLHAARSKLDYDDRVLFDIRSFPLELFNNQPTQKINLDAEIPVLGGLDPEAGWQMWERPESEYPGTTLPALEAVQAAKEQGLRASEQLDRRLRVGFFGESRVISLRNEILDLAGDCEAVDVDVLADAFDSGRARSAVMEQKKIAEGDEVRGSSHLFLPDGTDEYNPGIEMEWHGGGSGYPIIKKDSPEIYPELIERAGR